MDLGALDNVLPWDLNETDNPEFFNQDPEALYLFTHQLRAVTKGLEVVGQQKKAAKILTQFDANGRLRTTSFISGAVQFNKDVLFLACKPFTDLSPENRYKVLFWTHFMFTKNGALKLKDNNSLFSHSTDYEGFYKFLSTLTIEPTISAHIENLFKSEDLVKASLGLKALSEKLSGKGDADQDTLLGLIEPFEPERLKEDRQNLSDDRPYTSYDKSLEIRANEIALMATLPKNLWTKETLVKIRKIPHEHLHLVEFRFRAPLLEIETEQRGPVLDMIIHGLSMPHLQNPADLIHFLCTQHNKLMNLPENKIKPNSQ